MTNNNFLYKRFSIALPLWTVLCPLIACLLLLFVGGSTTGISSILMGAALISVVLAAVHHAEVVAHKVGEPYGTLILAIAITVIEVALIVSVMLSEGEQASALARDTVFAAIMIILTGIIGLCLLLGGFRYKEQLFVKQGVSASLVTLIAIAVLTLVLPNHTTSLSGPFYSTSQLLFVAAVSLVLYISFIAVQTIRHRDYFLPEAGTDMHEDSHASPPSTLTMITSLVLLLIALTIVIILSKKLSPVIESMIVTAGAPKSLLGIVIAAVILLPEGLAAVRAARKNRLQTSLNLALGSALASIGLTIPAVAVVAYFTGFTVTLGIDTKSTILLLLSLFTISISFNAGRTNILQGIVLLVIMATWLFTTIVP